jgi:hypothetical protein
MRFYVFLVLAAAVFARALLIRHGFAHWAGMMVGLAGFGMNLYGAVRQPADEPYPDEIPNQRFIIRSFIYMTLGLFLPLIAGVLLVAALVWVQKPQVPPL